MKLKQLSTEFEYFTPKWQFFGLIQLGDNTFVIEWFAGINCIILWSQI